MGYKSIEHTIHVHEQGVIAVFQDYKFQSQARINFLKVMYSADPVKPPVYMRLNQRIKKLFYETDPYSYVRLNDQLTQYIDDSFERFKLNEKEAESLTKIQQYVKQESLIFYSHATSFNSLLSRFPYRLLAKSYPKIPVTKMNDIDGVIVER